MRKITLTCEEGSTKTVMEFNSYGFHDVLTKINQFIKAAGYSVNDLVVGPKSHPIPGSDQQLTTSVTYHNGLTTSQLTTLNFSSPEKEQGVWKDYKFDTSKIDHINSLNHQYQYPTMAPLTSEQVYSWTVNPIPSIDLSSLTSVSLAPLKPEDIQGLNYKFNL